MRRRGSVQFNQRHARNGAADDATGEKNSAPKASRPGSGHAKSQQSEKREAPGSGWATENEEEVNIPLQQTRADREKTRQSIITRTIWTLVMIASFFALMFLGHIYVIIAGTFVQIICFKEVIAISNVPSRARSLRFTKTLNWYFLGITMYFLYGESVIYYFKHIVLIDRILLPFATHHRFISFMLYVIGFVFFVASLQKGHYKFQFTQFAWTHMALYLIVVQAHFIMNNIFEGMIWFFLPVCLVTTNDIFAYICGITFGRTRLIELSPKKTVEGFVGGWICTVIIGFGLTNLLMRSSYFTCPVNDLGANFFTGLQCEPNPVFIPRTFQVPFIPFNWTWLPTSITVSPMQFHILVMSTFASLIAPFAGFFASGIKRSFNIKDFGHSIPGHGGMTDRMDCQFIMGFFTYVYYQSFIAVHRTTVGSVIETAITGLTLEQQVEVVKGLTKHLYNQGEIGHEVLEYLGGHLRKQLMERN
ncbi:phosphatidate cytidylyltransferase [Piedraia hortae CBS 480.64]|uniref:Phosphatidate cytidylyltransferase n=1 Tax=Piedraia hortae CBS 480.64 TaxID=1314780 RepID=A0A6A7BYK6_9PEZI|nr:phosphatidate cytidylyltransferase [Piedraia hortae CBS 480.64]